MPIEIILQGIIIGFSIAAPVGPIGVLCIRRTLAEGRLSGFVSGLGAASADAIYGSIAGFGLTFISSFLISQGIWLRLVGGAFLIYLGIKTFLAQPSKIDLNGPPSNRRRSLVRNFTSTFFLTLTNPLTILSFVGIFAGMGIGTRENSDYLSAMLLVLGVFTGSAGWWFLLSGVTALFRGKVNQQTLLWVNRISGAIIIGFGIIAFISLTKFL